MDVDILARMVPMQSKQEFALVAAGRLGRKTWHGIYDYDERGAIRLPSPP